MTESLPELLQSERALTEAIILAEGEISPEIEAALDKLALDTEAKVEAYHYVLERFDFNAEFFKAKENKFAQLRKRFEKYAERMRMQVEWTMNQNAKNELHGTENGFKLVSRKGIEYAEIHDIQIPEEFQRVKIEMDKTKVKEALDGGRRLSFARLIQKVYLKEIVLEPRLKGKKDAGE